MQAADGTWLADSENGNWSDDTKWSGGDIADGVDSKMTLQAPTGSVAAGSGELLGGYTINLDSNRTVGSIELAAGAWSNSSAITIAGSNTLHFGRSSGPARVSGAGSNVLKFAIEVAEVTSNVGELIFDGSGICFPHLEFV